MAAAMAAMKKAVYTSGAATQKKMHSFLRSRGVTCRLHLFVSESAGKLEKATVTDSGVSVSPLPAFARVCVRVSARCISTHISTARFGEDQRTQWDLVFAGGEQSQLV